MTYKWKNHRRSSIHFVTVDSSHPIPVGKRCYSQKNKLHSPNLDRAPPIQCIKKGEGVSWLEYAPKMRMSSLDDSRLVQGVENHMAWNATLRIIRLDWKSHSLCEKRMMFFRSAKATTLTAITKEVVTRSIMSTSTRNLFSSQQNRIMVRWMLDPISASSYAVQSPEDQTM